MYGKGLAKMSRIGNLKQYRPDGDSSTRPTLLTALETTARMQNRNSHMNMKLCSEEIALSLV